MVYIYFTQCLLSVSSFIFRDLTQVGRIQCFIVNNITISRECVDVPLNFSFFSFYIEQHNMS